MVKMSNYSRYPYYTIAVIMEIMEQQLNIDYHVKPILYV